MKHIRRFLAVLVACLLFAGGALALSLLSGPHTEEGVLVSQKEYELLEKYRRLEEVLQIVDSSFLWDYDVDKMMEGAAQGMLGALEDDYTFYYTPDRMEKENESLLGEYGGLGIEVFPNAKDDTITIKRVFYGSPAQQGGLRPADKIIGVNGEEMRAGDMNAAVAIMRGEPGGEVTLTVLRDREIFEVTLARAVVQTQIVETDMLDGDIAYARIYYFEGNLMGQLEEAIAGFKEAGAKGIIIDLRENPGGLVNLATDLIDVFLGDVPILKTEDKYGRTLTYYAREGAWEIPVVVLVDGHSASASEIVAVALQESGVAKVVGTQTFGKGIMQAVYPFHSDGAGMQVTTDYWLSPSGNNLHEVGVTPDVLVELDEDAIDENYQFVREKDNQLTAAIETLLEMIQ